MGWKRIIPFRSGRKSFLQIRDDPVRHACRCQTSALRLGMVSVSARSSRTSSATVMFSFSVSSSRIRIIVSAEALLCTVISGFSSETSVISPQVLSDCGINCINLFKRVHRSHSLVLKMLFIVNNGSLAAGRPEHITQNSPF